MISWQTSSSKILSLRRIMSRLLTSLPKFAHPPSEIWSTSSFVRRFSVQYARTCVRPGPLLVVPTACVPRSGFRHARHYANAPGGGGGMPGGGFPGFSLGQQQQKGDALKDYVRGFFYHSFGGN